MFKNFTLLICVIIFTVISANAQKTDETAICDLVGQLQKGWNAKKGTEFAKPFAVDADYVVINGSQIKGRTAIAEAHQQIFDSVYKNTTIALSVGQIRFLHEDVAIAHISGVLTFIEKDSTKARMTLVLTKVDGRWEIVAFQNTEIKSR